MKQETLVEQQEQLEALQRIHQTDTDMIAHYLENRPDKKVDQEQEQAQEHEQTLDLFDEITLENQHYIERIEEVEKQIQEQNLKVAT